jgi:phosphoesterase RecJ-like protein
LKINPRGASALSPWDDHRFQRFQFGHVRAETFMLMGMLLSHGADLPALYRVLYDKSQDELSFERFVYNHYRITPAGFIYCHLTREDLAPFGLTATKANLKVNLLAHIENCPIWGFFSEDEGLIRAEIRSAGLDIHPIAHAHGGGGHRQASGFRLDGAGQISAVIEDIDKLIKERP